MAGAEPTASPTALVEDLFRSEHGRLIAALTRILGPANLALAEDVVQDALIKAMEAWRFGPPEDPRAWIVRTARNRAVDVIRRERRGRDLLPEVATLNATSETIDAALAPAEDAANQLAMMFAVCDPALGTETHVTMILRWLCGLSPGEIGRAFLVDPGTIDRRLTRGRTRLGELGRLVDVEALPDLDERRGSVLGALYLMFSEGYHGSDPAEPIRPLLCRDAIRLVEMLLEISATADADSAALAALFCFDAARLPARLDAHGVFVPLAEQDRGRWDRDLIDRGLAHLAASAGGASMSRWHLEAGIACEHALAPSLADTDWARIVDLYDLLAARSPGPVVALNRAMALAERDGAEAGRRELLAIAGEKKLAGYPFYWAALADLQRRGGRDAEARDSYWRAIELSRSWAERESYARRIELLEIP